MATTLNMQLLLRRAETFNSSYKLGAGEPGFEISTNTLKIGDGVKTWGELPIANKGLDNSYKTIQEVIAKVETDANVFIDTISQNENGEISITTKAVDFSAADTRFKKLQTAIEAVATEKNVFVEKIAQDAQGVITIYTKAVDFSDYRTAADQDTIDATFAKKADFNKVENKSTTEIKSEFTGAVEESSEGFVTGASVYTAIEAAKATVVGGTEDTADSATIAGAKKYADARKQEVVEMIDGVASAGLTRSIVSELPSEDSAAMNTIYMIKRDTGLDSNDIYDEYILIEVDGAKQFELLGNTELDLSNYYTKDQADDIIEGLTVDSITGFGPGKTLASLTETNGKIAASFQEIAITKSQITDFVESDYKTKQEAKEATATDANVFAYGIAQDENGVITVATKAVDFSNYYTKEEVDDKDDNTTYTVAATENALEFTVTPSEGDVQTVKLVAPTVDTGVMKVSAGTDIVVTPEAGTGEITVAHQAYSTGVIKDAAHDSGTNPSFLTSVSIQNGHVTGATVRNLAEVLSAMEFILDGGGAE